jgi:hypothetical protein
MILKYRSQSQGQFESDYSISHQIINQPHFHLLLLVEKVTVFLFYFIFFYFLQKDNETRVTHVKIC